MPNASEMERQAQELLLDQPVVRGINMIAVELQEAMKAKDDAYMAYMDATVAVGRLEYELREAALNV